MFNIAVFISGRGSNLESLLKYFNFKKNIVKISLVVSNRKDAFGLEIAKQNNIDTFLLNKEYSTYDILAEKIKEKNISLIVLAGFLKMIPSSFIKNFENKIINIHPALLPSFGGAGMYGINVHKAVFNKSCQVSGATVHFVNDNYDEGLIISQEAVDITNVKSPEEIAERVLKIEHKILPKVVENIALNKVKIVNNRIYIKREME
ncbi:MAG TPA: phosphoribosylglycinamide formyltransferase [Melioribacteraceae bacterium]|nr:phosphoribosylglycinamide formyltransferase [Melioribacteraceae bacterium]